MEWTVSRFSPGCEILLNEYFLAVGKALCIANHFEDKCNAVLRLVRITDAAAAGATFLRIKRIAASYQRLMLGPLIDRAEFSATFSETDVLTLIRAKDSRNHIAHEAARVGPLHLVREQHVYTLVLQLLPHVRYVVSGENLVSSWLYEVGEREPTPAMWFEDYPQRVVEWVFGDLVLRAEQSLEQRE